MKCQHNLGPFLADFFTEAPLDSKSLFLAKFVTMIVIAAVLGVGHGVLIVCYRRKP